MGMGIHIIEEEFCYRQKFLGINSQSVMMKFRILLIIIAVVCPITTKVGMMKVFGVGPRGRPTDPSLDASEKRKLC